MNHLEKYLRQQIIDDALLEAKGKKAKPASIEDIEQEGDITMFDTKETDAITDEPESTPKPKSPKKPKKPKSPPVDTTGIDFDPDDLSKPMSIRNFDSEGKAIRRSAADALEIFGRAKEIRSRKLSSALQGERKSRKKYKSLLKTDKTDPDYGQRIDKAERRLRLAQDRLTQARSIPEPDIEQFKPKLPKKDFVKSIARRAVLTGAAAIGTQLLGKIGDRAVKDVGIGVPGGGDAETQERARQGAANLGSFLKQAAFGDREAKETDTTLKKFGAFGATALKAADKLRSTSARQRDLNILAGKSRKRDIFTSARQSLGKTPFADREAQILGAIEKKTS